MKDSNPRHITALATELIDFPWIHHDSIDLPFFWLHSKFGYQRLFKINSSHAILSTSCLRLCLILAHDHLCIQNGINPFVHLLEQ